MKAAGSAWVRRSVLGVLMLGFPLDCLGQEDQIEYRNTVTAGVTANGVISESGKQKTYSLGFDYLYRLNPKWELGLQLDLNYDRSFEEHESDAIVPIAAYAVTERLPLFVGVGLERDRDTGDTEWLARVGFEYSFFLDKNRRVSLLPGCFIDVIHQEVLFSGVIALGFAF